MVEQQTQGTFTPQGREDILTTGIGKPEHPGRVRAVPGSIGLRQYFGPLQKTTQTTQIPQAKNQEALRQMDRQWEERFRQMEERFNEELEEQKQIQRALEEKLQCMTQGTLGVPSETPTPLPASTKGSCSAAEPTNYSGQYDMLVEGDPADNGNFYHYLWCIFRAKSKLLKLETRLILFLIQLCE